MGKPSLPDETGFLSACTTQHVLFENHQQHSAALQDPWERASAREGCVGSLSRETPRQSWQTPDLHARSIGRFGLGLTRSSDSCQARQKPAFSVRNQLEARGQIVLASDRSRDSLSSLSVLFANTAKFLTFGMEN